jgi:Esterase-like activity of phytase
MPRRNRLLALGLALALAPGTWLRSPALPPNLEQALIATPLSPGAERLGPFRLAGVWQLTSRHSLFGSYSAMVEPAPGRLLAFSDRGDFVDFAVPGGEQGPVRIGAVPGNAARYKHYRDIESASRDPATGRIFVALEGRNAVARHGSDLALEGVRQVPEMLGWKLNSGPEAMVRLKDGRFVVLCECTTGLFASGEHPALLFPGDPAAPGAARYFTFAGAPGYRPTDLALLPDGRVLVLVRRLTWPMPPSFKAKLLIADPDELAAEGIWRATELADISGSLPIDNFEALTVTSAKDGALVAWLLSDDNQALSQRTLLWKLDFTLSDLPPKQKAPGIPDAPR